MHDTLLHVISCLFVNTFVHVITLNRHISNPKQLGIDQPEDAKNVWMYIFIESDFFNALSMFNSH